MTGDKNPLEPQSGIEPPSSAWEAGVITIIRLSQKWGVFGNKIATTLKNIVVIIHKRFSFAKYYFDFYILCFYLFDLFIIMN